MRGYRISSFSPFEIQTPSLVPSNIHLSQFLIYHLHLLEPGCPHPAIGRRAGSGLQISQIRRRERGWRWLVARPVSPMASLEL